MLSIIFQSGKGRVWHVGEENPVTFIETNAVQEIQADGDELDHIKNMFGQPDDAYGKPTYPNIPNNRVVRLFGDFARTIIGNL